MKLSTVRNVMYASSVIHALRTTMMVKKTVSANSNNRCSGYFFWFSMMWFADIVFRKCFFAGWKPWYYSARQRGITPFFRKKKPCSTIYTNMSIHNKEYSKSKVLSSTKNLSFVSDTIGTSITVDNVIKRLYFSCITNVLHLVIFVYYQKLLAFCYAWLVVKMDKKSLLMGSV